MDEKGSTERTDRTEWTEITVGKEAISDISWPMYDWLWVLTKDGEYWLSKDQGESFVRIGSLKHRLLMIWLGLTKLSHWLFGYPP